METGYPFLDFRSSASSISSFLSVPAAKTLSSLGVAAKRLEKEFYQILSVNRDVLDSESVSNRSSRARSSVSDDDEASKEDDRISSSGTHR
ncbi:hypothetical protein L1887_25146 [Cichorium endivia]|nr:hypothetical protein L1887_25146 [Cichorium endivia]